MNEFLVLFTSVSSECSGALVNRCNLNSKTGSITGQYMRILECIIEATSEGSDEPAHLRSLARAFAFCIHLLWMWMAAQIESHQLA